MTRIVGMVAVAFVLGSCGGINGSIGPTGETGATGDPGSIGPTGDTAHCYDNVPPTNVVVSIVPAAPDGPYYVGESFPVTVTVDHSGSDPLEYVFVGAGGLFTSGVDSNQFNFVPGVDGGPFSFAVIVNDGCEVAVGNLFINSVERTRYLLTVTKDGTGTGSVTSDPAGIDCGSTCSAKFVSGTPDPVTLTAAAAAGSFFAEWGGACLGTASTDPCYVTMDEAKLVTATFAIDAVVTIAAIPGVAAVAGAIPVTPSIETAQYTGTISWVPVVAMFAVSTSYTATITLYAKTGFTLTGVGANFFTVAGATATNGAGSGNVSALFVTTSYALRDRGTANGWIFYINPSDGAYLEAAPASTETNKPWGLETVDIPGSYGTAIDTGQANTDAIIGVQGAGNTYAAQFCDGLIEGGKSDWFLPSIDELSAMYTNLYAGGGYTPVGDFTNSWYWSSSSYADSVTLACLVAFFNNGNGYNGFKSGNVNVRCVR